jgi:rare lipoprotein A
MVMERFYPMVRPLVAALVLPLLGAGCVVSSPVQEIRPAPSLEAPVVTPPAAMPVLSPHSEGMKGVATYYAKRFNGRRTTSGVPYDPNKLTAAHQSLPFGTKVKVVNLANGREVTVTVNDRCRKRSFPFIDLSRAAAERLGFFGKGTAKVQIIPMSSEGQ